MIGADIAGKLLTGSIRKLKNGLVAIQTCLGWTLMGKAPIEEKSLETLSVFTLLRNDKKISDLWDLDVLGISDPSVQKTKQELEESAKEHFLRTLKRNSDGRYEAKLPWVQDRQCLPNNKTIAEKRLNVTVKKLKDTDYLKAYEKVFQEWLQEEIIEEVNISKLTDTSCHYLPHRAVIKDSSTTKIRPVFDASAKGKSEFSLNDCLEKGPNMIEQIPSILSRFRMGKYGVTSDIRKAFLQIGISEEDRDYLRFLWQENGDPSRLKIYRHQRVVFGVNSSPFLLAATIHYHLEHLEPKYRKTAKKLLESMYVDNCVTSLDSVEELNTFIKESKEIMLLGKFDLRGWVWNKIHDSDSEEHSLRSENLIENELNEEEISVLGLKWNVITDELSCDTKDILEVENGFLTKRSILSIANRIFDPIGFLSPVTLIPKLLMQQCWKEKISWDSKLPESVENKFKCWIKNVKYVKDICIPRRLIHSSISKMSLHVFCDASQVAYACCAYLRTDDGSEVNCQLVQARSRVAPLKPISISRLELLACCIGVRLGNSIKQDLKIDEIPTFYWTDSMNALYWIKNQEPWATFVMNRVKEIRNLSSTEEWNHVPGHINPGDLPSRGCSPQTLITKRWWEGPEWLMKNNEQWPAQVVSPCVEVIDAERTKRILTSVKVSKKDEKFHEKISSYVKILRVVAWIHRFLFNLKTKLSKMKGDLTVKELKNAELILLRLIQKESFSDGDTRLKQLHPIVDENGLFRAKTQIFYRKDKTSFRMPIILPHDHSVVHKLIKWKHKELNHAGVQVLMNVLREKYWIMRSRKTIRQVLNQCVTCRRYSAQSQDVESPPLPENRVRDAKVFEISGVDLAGPLYLKTGQKSWVVLYTCAVFRAVHLELVTSLSTEAFLLSLRRFISRRGRPLVVYSDNGTNFSGASSALSKLDWRSIEQKMAIKEITWKFIPPASPWWGGWWERLVCLMKQTLIRVLGRASLNYEELYTLLCDTECLLNSRPLTALSEDVNDLIALTPDVFLHDLKDVRMPDLDNIEKMDLKKKYQHLQKTRENLRKRFRSEYLGQLRQRKYTQTNSSIQIGDLVLIGSDFEKRLHWPLARVIEVYPGKDGLVRVAKLKTQNGELIRSIKRLYPLEMGKSEAQLYHEKMISNQKNGYKDNRQEEKIPETKKKRNVPTPPDARILPDQKPLVTTRRGRRIKSPQRLNL